GCSSPAITLSKVDLPAPLRPIRPTRSPSANSSDTSDNACTSVTPAPPSPPNWRISDTLSERPVTSNTGYQKLTSSSLIAAIGLSDPERDALARERDADHRQQR